jgi:hypothetical protein
MKGKHVMHNAPGKMPFAQHPLADKSNRKNELPKPVIKNKTLLGSETRWCCGVFVSLDSTNCFSYRLQ